MNTKYLSVAQTAQLLRLALKESFPGTRFTVRSQRYSMGASITVGWTDGPNVHQVTTVTHRFEGSYFDGSIDYKGNRYHTLDGQPVSLGADSVHTHREYSDTAVARAIDRVQAFWVPLGAITVQGYRKGELYRIALNTQDPVTPYWNVQAEVSRALAKQSNRLAAAESPTLERLKLTGDDGYGQGTMGPGGALRAPKEVPVQ